MFNIIYNLCRTFFLRVSFFKFHKLLYKFSLHGLGILNFQSAKICGEEYFFNNYISKIKEGVIIDVGSHIGSYSIKARAANSKVKIYAFEPHPITFLKLQENVKNFDISVFNLGVGAKDGILKLYDYFDNDGSEHATLYKDVISHIHKGRLVEHDVKIVSLEKVIEEHKIQRIALLKIDTEGHEIEALKGIQKFIIANKVDLIHFEFNEMNVISRVFFKDFWNFLPNYYFFRMLPNGLVPINEYNPVFCEIFAYQNILAVLKK